MLRPTEHSGLDEPSIRNPLRPALEQIEQAHFAIRPVKFVLLFDGHPRHPAAFGGQRITRSREDLLLHEELLTRSFPLLLRHDRGFIDRNIPFPVSLVTFFARCHIISPFFYETD